WSRREGGRDPFTGKRFTKLYIRNYGVEPATLRIEVATTPAYPQAAGIPLTAIAIVVLFLTYIALRLALPQAAAIGLATYKSEIAQPLFMILLAFGATALIAFHFIPYNTFGEDIKMLKTSGITLIMILAIVQAIWAASTSIAEEIDGRTALTVLSKPLTRRDFIIGKFFGISWTVLLLFLLLALVLVIAVAYKPIHEARESSNEDPNWQECYG
ncbi:MAG: ABC transporter permease subunit, partial [Planctomycetales bacterium]|nr:ABC transporter permease subunit [Planctomycetales bacterium]